MIKVLILSRDPSWLGGVVNFVELLKSNFSSQIRTRPFIIGKRRNSKFLTSLLQPIFDSLRLYTHLRATSYNIIHLNPSLNIPSLFRDGLFLLVLRLSKNNKIFVTWHGWDRSIANRIKKVPFRFFFKSVFGIAQSMWVLSSDFASQLFEMGIQSNKICQYTTMFDGSIFRGINRNRNNDRIRLLFLSRFEREKGVYELLEAFYNLVICRYNTHLFFVGDGPEMSKMKKFVSDKRLDDYVTFTGYLRDADKVQILLDSDIFILPTYYAEGCPVSLLEAMAAGLPVITASAGGIPGIFKDSKNGFLLKEVVPSVISHTIIELINNPLLRKKFGEYNRREAWDKYEAKAVTQLFENHYFCMAGFKSKEML